MKNSHLLWIFIAMIAISCRNDSSTKPENSDKQDSLQKPNKPNIVLLYVDDLGYADLSSYGAKGVETPHTDSLARNGVMFTDAHSSAATCTPSRYSLLTGNYAFRNNAAILPGDAPLLIDTSMVTLPKMLQNAGYTTGVVGKWHLGLGYGKVNWNEPVTPGPAEVGFDYSFLLPATGDRVPTVFLEDDKVLNLSKDDPIKVSYEEKVGDRPLGTEKPELLKMKADLQHSQTIVNGISRIGYMSGGESAEWIDEEFPFIFTEKASNFITRNKANPFFLYFSFHDIHVPRAPNERFQGKSDMGRRGDAIVQMDYVVGEIKKILEKEGLAENTMIIFTSDNGPVLDDGYDDKAVELVGEHDPAGPFRGGKYSIYEGGTRVPMIVYWPGTVEPRKSAAMMNQLDFYASLAELVGQDMGGQIIDSENHLDALLGRTEKGREVMLEEAFTLALRDGDWKYIQPFTDGSIPDWMANKDIEAGLKSAPQLYDLSRDKAEQHNLAHENPEMVKKYEQMIKDIKNHSAN
ncbi:sulfatase-like hydrolase/transferase [Autumnicola musiva]|uniref:Sulfatase-like hydrolase/transferase n=1 Tax=Autumnicola musiva TaxID=3075589 RepID=A0ABU3D8Y1_9FLAO|nr:sulfatase-like hydrolase/transferase [Zunongwangia sp. F117]MDT0677901.1 sulfatase-like hydrolase/transferase [Zunongwangia sp. F117]